MYNVQCSPFNLNATQKHNKCLFLKGKHFQIKDEIVDGWIVMLNPLGNIKEMCCFILIGRNSRKGEKIILVILLDKRKFAERVITLPVNESGTNTKIH